MRFTTIHWPALLALALLTGIAATATPARAAPFLTADSIPLNNAPNVRPEYRIDGGPWVSTGCVWVLTAIQRDFYCDLAATDTTPTPARTYEARYAWDAGTGGDGAIYAAGVSGVSTPFVAPWRTLAAPTTLAIVPSAAP